MIDIDLEALTDGARLGRQFLDNVSRVIVSKADTVQLVLVVLICDGHVLLEDVPGVGKTRLATAVADTLSATFRRIQFAPDLLPSVSPGHRYSTSARVRSNSDGGRS